MYVLIGEHWGVHAQECIALSLSLHTHTLSLSWHFTHTYHPPLRCTRHGDTICVARFACAWSPRPGLPGWLEIPAAGPYVLANPRRRRAANRAGRQAGQAAGVASVSATGGWHGGACQHGRLWLAGLAGLAGRGWLGWLAGTGGGRKSGDGGLTEKERTRTGAGTDIQSPRHAHAAWWNAATATGAWLASPACGDDRRAASSACLLASHHRRMARVIATTVTSLLLFL